MPNEMSQINTTLFHLNVASKKHNKKANPRLRYREQIHGWQRGGGLGAGEANGKVDQKIQTSIYKINKS